jgi:hypothetical protein
MKAWLEDLDDVAASLEAEGHAQARPLRDLYDRLIGPRPPKIRQRRTLKPRWRR